MPRKLTEIVVPKRLFIKLVNAAYCAWQWDGDDNPKLLKARERTYLAAKKLLEDK